MARKIEKYESEEIQRDLAVFEEKFLILRNEYNIYFAGGRKDPPRFHELAIKKIIRKYIGVHLTNARDRFKYYNLVAKFKTHQQLWLRRMRMIETGMNPLKPMTTEAIQKSLWQREQARLGQRKLETPETTLKKLYREYVKAQLAAGDLVESEYDDFKNHVQKQRLRVMEEKNANDVRFQIVKQNGKIRLRAKVIRYDKIAKKSKKA